MPVFKREQMLNCFTDSKGEGANVPPPPCGQEIFLFNLLNEKKTAV